MNIMFDIKKKMIQYGHCRIDRFTVRIKNRSKYLVFYSLGESFQYLNYTHQCHNDIRLWSQYPFNYVYTQQNQLITNIRHNVAYNYFATFEK